MSVHPPLPELQDEDEHARSGHSHSGGGVKKILKEGRREGKEKWRMLCILCIDDTNGYILQSKDYMTSSATFFI